MDDLDDLDEAQVRALIAGGETLTVEFEEESRKPFNDRSLVETVACLANGEVGYLLVGVTDDSTVTGVRPRHEADRTDPVRVEALIANNTVPPVRRRREYRALDAASAYVRVRGFEPFQQEQMILAFVDARGRITRREAAELCAVDSTQARRLLARLVRDGRMRMRGEGRTAYYERTG